MGCRFNPEQVLADIQDYKADTLVVVLMVQRLSDIDPALIAQTDGASLRLTCPRHRRYTSAQNRCAIRWGHPIALKVMSLGGWKIDAGPS